MPRRLLPENRFLRRLAMLSGGTLLGQLLLVASSPLLTRLYGPEAFGALAVFSSLSAIVGLVAGLRYEFAVPVVADAEEAADLVGLGLATSALTAALTALGAWAAGPWLARLTGLPELAWLVWLLPATVLLNGLVLPLSFWSVRQGTFRVNTADKLVQGAGQVGPQLLLGAAGAGGPGGLVLGYSLGYLARLLHFLHALPGPERARLLLRIRWRRLWPLARRHWRYPAFSAPSTLLESAVQLLPAVLLAALYGPVVAGWFGLGQRVMGLPVKLLAQAASQVFLGEAPRLLLGGDPAAGRRLVARSAAGFAVVGLAGTVPVVLLGPGLFAFVFGEPWREAGVMAALLVPQHLARFVVLPVSQTLNIYGRQELHLVATLVGAAALAAAFGAAAWLGLDVMRAVLLYSVGTTAAYLLYLWFAWRVTRSGGGGGGPGAPAAAAPPPRGGADVPTAALDA
jgi:O-antigen/teichoic acid export membrane protein